MAQKAFGLIGLTLFAFAVVTMPARAENEPIELTFGHYWNPGHDLSIAVQSFADSVKEKSGGKLIISVFPSSQLGTGREMMEQVAMGTLSMAPASISDWATSLNMPVLEAFELPFLYKGLDSQIKLIKGILAKELQPLLEGTNLRHIMSYANSVRNVIVRNKPINTLEDFQGLKMRSPETNLFVELFKSLGCNIVISPWAEVYTVLSQGVADAIEADAVGLLDMNLQEVGKFYSRTSHMGAIPVVFINDEAWNSLTPELQKIVMDCAAENMEQQMANRQATDEKAEKALEDAGVAINDITDAERARMRETVMHLYTDFAAKFNKQDLIDSLLALEK